jgi:hypothetical protein
MKWLNISAENILCIFYRKICNTLVQNLEIKIKCICKSFYRDRVIQTSTEYDYRRLKKTIFCKKEKQIYRVGFFFTYERLSKILI